MKKKKDANIQPEEVILNSSHNVRDDILADGCRSEKELLAPAMIKENSESEMKVDSNYARTFVMNGYRPNTEIGWLDDIFNYNGDIDSAIYVEPVDERTAIDEITKKISQYETDQLMEMQKGSIKNTTRNAAILKGLYMQRDKLEQSQENSFLVEILCTLFNPDLKELNKESQKLISKLAGKKNKLMPLYLRQEEGFRSVLPFGLNYITDYYRNFGTGSASDCFPFYNAEYSQEQGYMFALNYETGTPIFIDPFDKNTFNNANISVFGGSGSGKTYAVSLLVLHFLIQMCYCVVIDADGEFRKVTEAAKGVYLPVAPGEYSFNPFDIDVEEEVDEDGVPTGRKFVNVKDKVASLLNLIILMCGEKVAGSCLTKISEELLNLYADFGITEAPNSLYEESSGVFDRKTGQITTGRKKKRVPQFSNFWDRLNRRSINDEDSALVDVCESLKKFKKGGLYDMFDCQTTEGIDIENAHLLTFDVSRLEEDLLRPIGMYIVFTWVWDKFIKKNPNRQKVVVLEEAWMLIKKSLSGSKYTAEFVEKAARRIRKRNGSLIVSSQNVREFEKSEQGQSVLDNTTIKILLGQEPADIATTQRIFQLSDGETKTILNAKRGDGIIKTKFSSTKCHVFAFPFEDALISKKYLKNK